MGRRSGWRWKNRHVTQLLHRARKGRCPPVSFFVWKNDTTRNTLERFPATIAYQLCQNFQVLAPRIEKAINTTPLLLRSTFKKQMDKLVIAPLLDACDTVNNERHLIIVVDGVDELDTKGQQEFLAFIPYLMSQLSPLPISLLVSSRPETNIAGALNQPDLKSITCRITIQESPADILRFLLDEFKEINVAFPCLAKRYGQWPGQEVIDIMLDKSSRFFIWPTVAISYVAVTGKGRRHNDRLQFVLPSSSVDPWVSHLDVLYRAILETHSPNVNDPTFLPFQRRLALLCLPVDLGSFVWQYHNYFFDGTPILLHAVFEETLDDVWDAVADLSSMFLHRKPLSVNESPLPMLSHRSLQSRTLWR